MMGNMKDNMLVHTHLDWCNWRDWMHWTKSDWHPKMRLKSKDWHQQVFSKIFIKFVTSVSVILPIVQLTFPVTFSLRWQNSEWKLWLGSWCWRPISQVTMNYHKAHKNNQINFHDFSIFFSLFIYFTAPFCNTAEIQFVQAHKRKWKFWKSW